jgi:hypothetical protein
MASLTPRAPVAQAESFSLRALPWIGSLIVSLTTITVVFTLVLVSAVRGGEVAVVLIIIFLSLWLFLPVRWFLTRMARKIEVIDIGIRATPFIGHRTLLRWDEITRAQQWDPMAIAYPYVFIRLIDRSGRSIHFSSEIVNFEDLRALISSSTQALQNVTEPKRWEKLLYRGWP